MASSKLSHSSVPPKISDLHTSNKRGWRQWLITQSLYPCARIAACALLLCLVLPARAEVLPSAPTPSTAAPVRFTATDWAITGGMVAGRALDWATTREVLRRPCWGYEKELPAGLARSKVGLAAFEAGALTIELYSQHQLRRHGHNKAARAVGIFNASVSLGVDAHNWSVARR